MTDHGCSPEDEDATDAEWQRVYAEELRWRELEDILEAQKEMERARGE